MMKFQLSELSSYDTKSLVLLLANVHATHSIIHFQQVHLGQNTDIFY